MSYGQPLLRFHKSGVGPRSVYFLPSRACEGSSANSHPDSLREDPSQARDDRRQRKQRVACLYVLGLLLLTLGSCHSVRQSYRAVYVGETGNRFVGTTPFRDARIRQHPYRLQLTTPTGATETRQPGQVWGIQQTGGPRFRLYQGAFYEEIDSQSLLIYRQADLGGSTQDRIYFSLSPTSELVPLTRHNLEIAGQRDPQLLPTLANSKLRSLLNQADRHRPTGK